MMKRNGFLTTALMMLLLLGAGTAHAQQTGAQFGLVYGLSVPDADNTNPFKVWGLKGQAFMAPQFTIGGYYWQSDRSGQISSANKFAYELTGIETAYHLLTQQGDTSFAVRAGVTKVSENPNLIDMTFSPYHYGIALGYDYYLTNHTSVGFEGSYIHVLPGRTTMGGMEYDTQSFNIISFLLSFLVRI